jgi:hypothetical protein
VPEANVLQKPFSWSTILEKVQVVLSSSPCKHLGETKVGGPA